VSGSLLAAGDSVAATGTYPREVFDPLMGFNRWCYRVLAYVALMPDPQHQPATADPDSRPGRPDHGKRARRGRVR